MAGSSVNLFPEDSPEMRIDPNGSESIFNSVGSLRIDSLGRITRGTAIALNPYFAITAGHNLDTDDNGIIDPDISIQFQLNLDTVISLSPTSLYLHPDFSGFGNMTVNDDLAILQFSQSMPDELSYFPLSRQPMSIGDIGTLVGYGRSGYGNIGYASLANATDKRIGQNVIDALLPDDEGSGMMEVFQYDFDDPSTFGLADGSLGNSIETLVGSGDSGSPFLIEIDGQFALAGINTYTDGAGLGRFGELGGGIDLYSYTGWIDSVVAVPESKYWTLFLSLFASLSLYMRIKINT